MDAPHPIPPASTANGGTIRSPWPTFVVCAIAVYITALDLSVVNVAFAEIAKRFNGHTRGELSWVVSGYAIVFGSLLLVAGQLADRLGRKRVFLAGTAVFLCGSALCGAAPGLGTLVAGRILQGVGGAFLTPASSGLLLGAFDMSRRTQVMSWVGGIGALGIASGPTVGAFMIHGFGWESAFWVNLPICAFALAMGSKVLHETPRQAGPTPDIAGCIAITVAVAGLVAAISEGSSWGWDSGRVIGLVVGALAIGLTVVWRSQRHRAPAIPVDLFSVRTFAGANLGSLLFGAAFSGMALNNVLFLRTIWRYNVVTAGWFSVVSPLVVAVVSTWAGKRAKVRGFRGLLIAGPLAFAIAELGFALLMTEQRHPWQRWVPLAVLLGVSIGCTFPVLAAAAVSELPSLRFAVGSAVNNTFRQVGAAIGVACVVAIESSNEGIAGFRGGWLFSAVASAGASLVAAAVMRRPVLAIAAGSPERQGVGTASAPR